MFYHCILKCCVLIDLKRGEIKHGDIGQMNLYLNYFKTEICQNEYWAQRKMSCCWSMRSRVSQINFLQPDTKLYLPKREELQAQLDKVLDEYSN